MTPTEAELLRAFVVAAREYYRLRSLPSGDLNADSYAQSRFDFERADAALSAYRATPAVEGETVEVRAVVLMSPDGKEWTVGGASEWDDDDAEMLMRDSFDIKEATERRIATITARVPLPVIPTVEGSVT